MDAMDVLVACNKHQVPFIHSGKIQLKGWNKIKSIHKSTYIWFGINASDPVSSRSVVGSIQLTTWVGDHSTHVSLEQRVVHAGELHVGWWFLRTIW